MNTSPSIPNHLTNTHVDLLHKSIISLDCENVNVYLFYLQDNFLRSYPSFGINSSWLLGTNYHIIEINTGCMLKVNPSKVNRYSSLGEGARETCVMKESAKYIRAERFLCEADKKIQIIFLLKEGIHEWRMLII